MDTRNQHGGPRPGSGRKPIDAESHTVSFPVKMSATQREKLKRLGGAPWVRDKIDAEPEPPSKE